MQSVAAAAARGDRPPRLQWRFLTLQAILPSTGAAGVRILLRQTDRRDTRPRPDAHYPARGPCDAPPASLFSTRASCGRIAGLARITKPARNERRVTRACTSNGSARSRVTRDRPGMAGPPRRQACNLLHASASISAIASAPCVQRHYLPGPSRRAIFTGRLLHRPRPLRRRDRSRHFLTAVPPAWRKALREARRRIENLYRNSGGRYESHWMLGFVLSSKWRVNQIEGG